MKVLILGSTSQLASLLLRFQDELQNNQIEPVFLRNKVRLGEEIPSGYLEEVDCVLNFSLSSTGQFDTDLQLNKRGVLIWANQISGLEEKTFVQISSDAVRFNPESRYSRIKGSVDTAVLKVTGSRVLRIPTLIGEEIPNPSRNLFKILNFEKKVLKSIYVPGGFVKTKNLKFLKINDFWSSLRMSLKFTSRITTPVSHSPEDLFTLVEIWREHQKMIGLDSSNTSAYKTIDINYALSLYDKGLRLGLPYSRTAEALKAFV